MTDTTNEEDIINLKTKVGFIIPTTTKGKLFNSVEDLYFVKYTFDTFIQTLKNYEHFECVFYVGYDYDDKFYSEESNRSKLIEFLYTKYPLDKLNVNVKLLEFPRDIPKGYLTRMWNFLYDQAYEENCNYFYQCGDDIKFRTMGWLYDSVQNLKKNNDIGISGPVNDGNIILTQAMFSRKHKEIFGYFLEHETIKNWYLDDWYNLIYSPEHVNINLNHLCVNTIQNAVNENTYTVSNVNNKEFMEVIKRDKEKINMFLNR